MRAPVCAIARRAAKAAPARPRKVERLRLMSAQRKLEALSDGARLGGLREAHQHGAMNRLDRSSTNDRLGGRPRRAAHGRAEGGTGYKHAAAEQGAEYHRSRETFCRFGHYTLWCVPCEERTGGRMARASRPKPGTTPAHAK